MPTPSLVAVMLPREDAAFWTRYTSKGTPEIGRLNAACRTALAQEQEPAPSTEAWKSRCAAVEEFLRSYPGIVAEYGEARMSGMAAECCAAIDEAERKAVPPSPPAGEPTPTSPADAMARDFLLRASDLIHNNGSIADYEKLRRDLADAIAQPPRPQPTREQIAAAMWDHWAGKHGHWYQHTNKDDRERYLSCADAVLSLLHPVQETTSEEGKR